MLRTLTPSGAALRGSAPRLCRPGGRLCSAPLRLRVVAADKPWRHADKPWPAPWTPKWWHADAGPPEDLAEIAYDAARSNSVSLIANLVNTPELLVIEGGRMPSVTGLELTFSHGPEVCWIRGVAVSPLAERVAAHLKKGDRIQVHGTLKQSYWAYKEMQPKHVYTPAISLNVSDVWRIRKLAPRTWMQSSFRPPTRQEVDAEEATLWEELRASPENFWDNCSDECSREDRHIRHKESGNVLWLQSPGRPDWILEDGGISDEEKNRRRSVARGEYWPW